MEKTAQHSIAITITDKITTGRIVHDTLEFDLVLQFPSMERFYPPSEILIIVFSQSPLYCSLFYLFSKCRLSI